MGHREFKSESPPNTSVAPHPDHNKLNHSPTDLRPLVAHLFKQQEQEQQRLARQLHDDVSQRLSLVEILLDGITGDGGEPGLDRLQSARDQVRSLNNDLRQISNRLYPSVLDDLGLSAALNAMVKQFGERENIPAVFLTRNLPENWSQDAATAIYRIAQEALRNVAQHAGKTHVKVVLSGLGRRLRVRVIDFGAGFDTESPSTGMGMISMRLRAQLAGGTLHIESAPGHGTTITADVPSDRNA